MIIGSSGFPSTRTNLSPFTKDFRGGEQVNESIDQFFVALPCGGACQQEMQSASNDRLTVVRELTVLRGLRAINQEWLLAFSIEILTAAAPFSSLMVVACFARDQRKEPSMRMRRVFFFTFESLSSQNLDSIGQRGL